VQGVGGYEECKARSEEVEVEGIRFSVLDLAALIDAKRAAGRPRDMEHLKELEAIRELRREA
jgi:predicted nucleotidyltransferase